MKKILSILLIAALALSLVPLTASAAEPTKLNHIDIVFDMPKAGDSREMETEVTVRSIKSGNIDLMAAGATIMYTEWAGDDVETEDDFLFRAGTTYLVTIKLAFDTTKGYCANYKMLEGDTVVTADTFTATVNGQPATARTSAPYFPTLQVSLKIEGERMTDTERAELAAKQEKTAAALAKARRAVYPARTQAEADVKNPENKGKTVVIMDREHRGEGYNFATLDAYDDIGTLIMDVDDSDFYNHECATGFAWVIVWKPYLNEIWLSDKVDVYTFVGRMDGELHDPVFHSPLWESRSDLQFCTTDATLYIPESSVAEFAKKMTEGRGYSIPYSIKVYSGNDVYGAQKAGGAAATKDWCPGHVYTHQIRSADRVYTFANCQTAPRWYYSCAICGKCEYNPNHVSANFKAKPIEKLMEFTHATLYDELATDEAYIGVNAAGMHVYWLSCDVCGRSDRYLQQHLTEKDLTLSGNDSTLEHYQQEVNAALQMRETLALSSTEDQAGMFTLRLRNTAKTSAWAQSDVNFALNDNLLDLDLLGNDYTKNISRLQFCSVVVRLAEEMTGKTITPAAANTFTDTNSPYVLKAYAAGITSGTSATTFSPDATLNRQQMATFLYRTLRYIEKNSDYKYTSYTSKLANYADNAQLESWAVESMAFMNALDLIKGTADTTLSPNNKCTIEQAIAVAERSVYAHQIGWCQVEFSELKGDSQTDFLTLPVMGTNVGATPREGTIIWSLGKRLGVYMDEPEIDNNMPYTYCPVINYYTGQKQYIVARDLVPIRN